MPFSHYNSFTCRLSHRPGALDVEYNLRPVIRNPQNGALYLLYPTEFGPLKKQGCQILAPMVSLCFISSQSIFEKLESPTHSVCADNQCNLTGMYLVIAFIPGVFYAANKYPTFQRNENYVNCQSTTYGFVLNYPEWKTNLSVLMKNSKFWVKTYKFFNYAAPYCRESKIQHPTSRIVGTLKYAPASYINSIAMGDFF